MRLVVTCADQRQEIPVRLFPTICNGSFEIDRAGDGKPEYWIAYDYLGKVGVEKLHPLTRLDADRPRDGKRCLRVDPYGGGEISAVCVYAVGTMLSPNTTYQVSGYLRVPAGGKAQLWWDYQPVPATGEPDANGWQRFEKTTKTGTEVAPVSFQIQNAGPTPIWADTISVRRVGT